MTRKFMQRLAMLATVSIATLTGSTPLHAHGVQWGDWDITLHKLTTLVPEADPNAWRVQRVTLSDVQAAALAKDLGFELYAGDKTPEFFVAHDRDGALLSVVTFVDARVEPKLVDGVSVPLRIGVGVDARGVIERVHVFDDDGFPALREPAFVDQLRGRNLQCSFAVAKPTAKPRTKPTTKPRTERAAKRGPKHAITPVTEAVPSSVLVANAAREALVRMAIALGRDGAVRAACPLDADLDGT